MVKNILIGVLVVAVVIAIWFCCNHCGHRHSCNREKDCKEQCHSKKEVTAENAKEDKSTEASTTTIIAFDGTGRPLAGKEVMLDGNGEKENGTFNSKGKYIIDEDAILNGQDLKITLGVEPGKKEFTLSRRDFRQSVIVISEQ